MGNVLGGARAVVIGLPPDVGLDGVDGSGPALFGGVALGPAVGVPPWLGLDEFPDAPLPVARSTGDLSAVALST